MKKKIQVRKARTAEDLNSVWNMWKEIMEQKIYYPYDTATYSRQDIEEEWINLVHNHVHVATLVADATTTTTTTTTATCCDRAQQEKRTGTTLPEIVGAFILKPNQPGYGNHICNAAYMVGSAHRGQGIGDDLCRHSIRVAKQAGYRGIQFNLVVSTNEAALKIWNRNGFELVGVVPGGFYHEEKKDYVDAFIFFKSLV